MIAYKNNFTTLILASLFTMGIYILSSFLQPFFHDWIFSQTDILKHYAKLDVPKESKAMADFIFDFPYIPLFKSLLAMFFVQILGVFLFSAMLVITGSLLFKGELSLSFLLHVIQKRLVVITFFAIIFNFILMAAYSLLILPGIYILPGMIFALPILLFDEYSIFNSLKFSFKLTYKNWWYSFSAISMPLLLVLFCQKMLSHVSLLGINQPERQVLILYALMLPFCSILLIQLVSQLKVRRILRLENKGNEEDDVDDENLEIFSAQGRN
jgi:hypothetical protein